MSFVESLPSIDTLQILSSCPKNYLPERDTRVVSTTTLYIVCPDDVVIKTDMRHFSDDTLGYRSLATEVYAPTAELSRVKEAI